MKNIKGNPVYFRGVSENSRFVLLKSIVLVLISYGLFVNIANGQTLKHPDSDKINLFITKVKDIYGVDDELINGYPYYPPNEQIAAHPYFKQESWRTGSVFMNGEVYQGLPVKYDLTIDAIVIKATLKKDVIKMVHLNSLYVDSVVFDNHLFVHSRKYFKEDRYETFFEEVYLSEQPSFGYLIHYKKQYLDQYTSIAPRGRFSDTKEQRYLLIKGELHEVDRRRTFLKAFEQADRRSIRSYMRKQHIRYNQANNKEIRQVMEYCQDLLTK